MFLPAILVLAACGLVARQAASPSKEPREILAALVLGGLSLFLQAARSEPAWVLVAEWLLVTGTGSLLVSGYLRRRREPARPFFALGSLFLFISVVTFAVGRLVSPASEAGTADDAAAAVFLVELGPDDRIDELTEVLAAHGATAAPAFENVTLDENADLAQVFIVSVPAGESESLVSALRADIGNVDHVEANRTVSLGEPAAGLAGVEVLTEVRENDPLVSRQWALEAIGAHVAHGLLQDRMPSRRAIVAIVDTGIDAGHEDLEAVFSASPGSTDPHGHGSHCAGIAASVTNNGVGIASLNWEGRFVEIRGYVALNAGGQGTIEQIAQAVIDAAEDRADVISLSLGDRSPEAPKTIRDAVAYARSLGAVVVASAGNSGEDGALHMPSNVDGVIAVSAVDRSLRRAAFSNTVGRLDRPMAAPGVDILSARAGGDYVTMSGTSMATPMVAGVLGILKALDPSLGEAELYEILRSTGRTAPDEAATGRVLDAGAAVRTVLERIGG